MKLLFTIMISLFGTSSLAFADMQELFQRKAAMEEQQRAEAEQTREAAYAARVSRVLENVASSFAAKHRGFENQPKYTYCDYCGNQTLLNSIAFTTRDGYECEARRLSLMTTFNAEVHPDLYCIHRETLKTIWIVKVDSRWQRWTK